MDNIYRLPKSPKNKALLNTQEKHTKCLTKIKWLVLNTL